MPRAWPTLTVHLRMRGRVPAQDELQRGAGVATLLNAAYGLRVGRFASGDGHRTLLIDLPPGADADRVGADVAGLLARLGIAAEVSTALLQM